MRQYTIHLSEDGDDNLTKLQDLILKNEGSIEPFMRGHITPDVLVEAGLTLLVIIASMTADIPEPAKTMLQGAVRAAISNAVTKQYPETLDAFLDTMPPFLRDVVRKAMTQKPDVS